MGHPAACSQRKDGQSCVAVFVLHRGAGANKVTKKTLIFVEPTPLKMIVCVINKVTSKALFCFVQCVSHFVLLIQKVMKCACVFRGDGRKGSNRYESRVIPVDGQFSE